jgi:hypothetical protein
VRQGADQRKLEGYILAHEFGHWAYSLGDEYQRFQPTEVQPVSVMSHAQEAVNAGNPKDNLQWLNFSTESSIRWQSAKDHTTQYQSNGAASWEFLQTPCSNRIRRSKSSGAFTPDGSDTQYPQHYPSSVFYQPLAAAGVAPSSSESWLNPNDGQSYPTMRPDLTGFAATDDPLALDQLKVTWVDTANVEMDLILDTSTSMGSVFDLFGLHFPFPNTPLWQVKFGTVQFAAQAIVGRTTLGITTFNDVPNPSFVPLTPVNAPGDLGFISGPLLGLEAEGATSMYAAAKASLQKLQAYRTAQGTNALQVAFLLSDGEDNASGAVTEAEVISLYKQARVRLHTVGYTDNPNEIFLDSLKRLAQGTGGVYHRTLRTYPEIAEAMRIAYGDTLTVQDIALGGLEDPMPVDTLYSQIDAKVNYRLNEGGGVTFAVHGPDGSIVPAVISTRGEPDGSATAVVRIEGGDIQTAGTGYWQLVPTFTGTGGTILSQNVQGMPGDGPLIELMLSTSKTVYQYPEPIQIFARTVSDGDITSVVMDGQLRAPDGSTIPVVLTDDGSGNDAAAYDGLYSGQVTSYSQNGAYSLRVSAQNLGNAVYVRSQGPLASNGGATDPVYQPLGIPFSRRATQDLSVAGVVADDHGNTSATATTIAANAAPHYGKLEVSGDVDFFRINGATPNAPLSVRVYDHQGVQPKVTVYASNGSLLNSRTFALGGAVGGYLSVAIPAAQVVSPLFVKVEDEAGGAGTYTLDVSAPIASDRILAPPFISQLANGDLQFSITFPAPQAYVEAIAEREGLPLISGNIAASQLDNGDGTFTYVRTVAASNFQAADEIRARYYSYEASSPPVLTPGPTPDVWLPSFVYDGGFQCPTKPLGACGAALLTPVSALASSTESASYPASQAIDGDFGTRWSSAFNDAQTLKVDLGTRRAIHRAILYWEDAASSDYDIQVSDDATTWTTVYTDSNGNGGTDDIVGLNATGRYVRVYSRHRTTQWGNSLWEVLLFGDADPTCTTRPAAERACVEREPARLGGISFEKWLNASGGSLSDIPTATRPDYIERRASFEGLHDIADNYGVRMRGWLTPPKTGAYKLWVAGDDKVALYLSPNASPAQKALIAQHGSFTGFREWNKFTSQQSAPVTLEQGRWYYIEALMKEQSGQDHLSVGWLKPGETGTQPSEIIPGTQLAPYVDSAAPPPVSVGYHTIRNVNSSKCVDVASSSQADGGNIQQWQCTTNNTAQIFDLQSRGDDYYWIVNRHSHKCAHVSGDSTASGANVEQRACDNHTSYLWELLPLGSDRYRAVNVKSGMCLDVAWAGTQSGANIQQATCSSNLAQAFTFGAP